MFAEGLRAVFNKALDSEIGPELEFVMGIQISARTYREAIAQYRDHLFPGGPTNRMVEEFASGRIGGKGVKTGIKNLSEQSGEPEDSLRRTFWMAAGKSLAGRMRTPAD